MRGSKIACGHLRIAPCVALNQRRSLIEINSQNHQQLLYLTPWRELQGRLKSALGSKSYQQYPRGIPRLLCLLELRYGSERRSQSDMLTRMLSLLGG
ncbi:hypothetical protein PC122_g5857 [Phytophthora cactorum]|nr:hypothetical protein PC122_g5857 [Phytophthora cactorum]